MTLQFVLFVLCGALIGGFINGLAGTATALFALGFFLAVLDPIKAVAVIALISVLSGVQGLWVVRKELFKRPRRLLTFLIPGLLGLPIGLAILDVIDASVLRLGVAFLLIVYGGYFAFRSTLPAFERKTPVIDGTMGFAGGVLGGAASLSGALPTLWLSLRPWSKTETRATLQPYNFVLLSSTVVVVFFKGAYDSQTLSALAIAVPVSFVASWFGIFVFGRLSSGGFRRLLIVMTLLVGVGVLVTEVV